MVGARCGMGQTMALGLSVTLLLLTLFAETALAGFTPLGQGADNGENRTGLWFCPKLGEAADILPLKVRLYATRESVTDGVALRVEVKAGSTGTITLENSPYPAGSAGITMYLKASEKLDLTIKGRTTFAATTDWQKVDLPWEKLGTSKESPDIGYQFEMGLAAPAEHDVWYIVDRLGTEGPAFDPKPAVTPAAGPDETINTADIVGNAEVLAPTVARLKAKQPFKIVAFGDSLTAGAQATRGNWNIKEPNIVPFLYFSHLARLLEERFGYKGITPVQNGHGGWTSEQAKTIMAEAFAPLAPEDVLILEFGGNDLGWAGKTVDSWLANTKDLITEAKKKTSQIIIMSPTTGGQVPALAEEITKKFRAFAKDEKVAYVDITRWSLYRGEKYAWAYLANEYHPDFMGHIMMAELMQGLFTGENFDWPPYAAKKQP